MTPEFIEAAAHAAHEANRAFCILNGDHSHPPWDSVSKEQKGFYKEGVQQVIERNGFLTPMKLHDFWVKYRTEQGWTYGPEKCPIKKTHPSMVPYNQLSAVERAKDWLFIDTVENMLQVYSLVEEED